MQFRVPALILAAVAALVSANPVPELTERALTCPVHRIHCDIACSIATAEALAAKDPNSCTSSTQCAAGYLCCPPACGCYNTCVPGVSV
ncbi:hypothetical protein TWF694_002429 [Orbilia ellipsospora]|uniref:Uncharacterized protein n=1 Tax=Orbilia ellipsospora TaxID=2528407 RepID=A0AAV9X216_9PEZI